MRHAMKSAIKAPFSPSPPAKLQPVSIKSLNGSWLQSSERLGASMPSIGGRMSDSLLIAA